MTGVRVWFSQEWSKTFEGTLFTVESNGDLLLGPAVGDNPDLVVAVVARGQWMYAEQIP